MKNPQMTTLLVPLTKAQTNYLFKTCLVSGIPSAYALYAKQPLGLVPFSILCTSILYWSDPRCLWKRYVDMTVSMSTIGIHSLVVFTGNYNYKYVHFPILAFGCLSYPIGISYHKQNRLWLSTYWHSMVHVFCNLAAFILYFANN